MTSIDLLHLAIDLHLLPLAGAAAIALSWTLAWLCAD
jgi:hypothetical protein